MYKCTFKFTGTSEILLIGSGPGLPALPRPVDDVLDDLDDDHDDFTERRDPWPCKSKC